MKVRLLGTITLSIAAAIATSAAPAAAEVDLSGVWAARIHEDLPYRGPGPLIGEFLGIPVNDEGRARADAWKSSLQALPEHQCIMYTSHYLVMQPFGTQVVPETDPISGQVIAWRFSGSIDRPPLTVWMDGREHPSKAAPHSAAGFTTGAWQGDTLVAHTTHLTEGMIWRNGVPHSDEATITSFFARRDSVLTVTMILDDPVYLEEPFIRSNTFQLDPAVRLVPDTCQPQVEIAREPGEVPHYLPGDNPYVREGTDKYNLPFQTLRGGAVTTYPEYKKMLTAYVPPRPVIQAQPVTAASCERLRSLSLPHTAITGSQAVPAGAFVPPPPPQGAQAPAAAAYADLAAFCRVSATLTPVADSEIKMEIWMPVPVSWNGKLRGTGVNGLGGAPISTNALAGGLRRGYATAAHNSGHEGDSRYLLAHPERVKDFGYRATHEMTVASKAIVNAFYGRNADYAVIAEGGGGTVAGLSAAQRYPDDYDLVGVNGMSGHWTRLPFGQMWYWQATHKDPASFIPPSKYPVLNQGARDACDALDGLKDGIIGDVEHCRFDPAAVQCSAADAPTCLTPAQVEAARKIYQGPIDSTTKQPIYSPMFPGSELGWARLAGGEVPWFIPVEFFKYYVVRDPAWDYKTRPIDFDKDTKLADRPDMQAMNAINPDLKKFFARGGKMLMVDGWADTDVPPKVAIDYYNKVVATTGAGAVKESMRFFMVPGMAHVPGTAGAENFNFDALGILEEWKRTGKAPDTLVVTHLKNGVEIGKRLVCQYPLVSKYAGSGNPEDPASYVCK